MEACVVGGGPVGLFAAACLNARDVPVRVVDAEGDRPVRSYACALHPETLRLFEGLGLMPVLQDRAHRVDRLFVSRSSERVAVADFRSLDGAFPHVLTLRQSDLQDLLTEELARRGVEVSWRQEVTDLALREEYVSTTTVPMSLVSGRSAAAREVQRNGDPVIRRADYVIAADGYHSTCRDALGIIMLDLRRSEAFAMFEFEADLGSFEHEAHLVVGADSVSAFWPLGATVGRWTFQLTQGLDATPSLDLLLDLLRVRAPWFRPRPEQVCWSGVAHFERRIADRFGAGRIWLAGDSAHVTSPIGFQNMNRGFVEASELARVIGNELDGREPACFGFERFEREQRAEWRRLLGAGTRVSSHGAFSDAEGARLVPCLPASGHDLEQLLAQLQLRAALD
jgi:3-(3-hydroxy-phenyl)propionate hydroxylase